MDCPSTPPLSKTFDVLYWKFISLVCVVYPRHISEGAAQRSGDNIPCILASVRYRQSTVRISAWRQTGGCILSTQSRPFGNRIRTNQPYRVLLGTPAFGFPVAEKTKVLFRTAKAIPDSRKGEPNVSRKTCRKNTPSNVFRCPKL